MFERLRMPTHEPLFLNEGSSASELELRKLEAIRGMVKESDLERLEREISLLRAGIAGEKKVIFELANSHYPLAFIHDLNLECDGTSAQIDFLVVTPCNTLVLECKNLVGNIEVDSFGAFVRTFVSGRRSRREGIYSPVAQNARHLELLKAVTRSRHGTLGRFVQKLIADDYYHSLIVLANERSLLDAERAPEDVRDQIVRGDQLVARIKELDLSYAKKNDIESFSAVERRARRWLEINRPRKINVADRYELEPRRPVGTSEDDPAFSAAVPDAPATSVGAPEVPFCPLCGAPMVLRTARYGKNKGNKFWGCSTYAKTRCHGIVNVG